MNYSETDQMGVAYHAQYLVWLDVARTEHLRACGASYRDLEAEGLRLAVSEVVDPLSAAGAVRRSRPGTLLGPGRRLAAGGVRLCGRKFRGQSPAGDGDRGAARPRFVARAPAPSRGRRTAPSSGVRSGPTGPRRIGRRCGLTRTLRILVMPFFRGYRLLLVLALVQALPVLPAAAQQQTVVEQLAPLLAAEDARNFQPRSVPPRARGSRLARAPRGGPGRRPDRRFPRDPVDAAAACGRGFDRPARRGLRPRRAARHGGRPAAHRPADRPAGARRSHAPPKR